MDQRDICCSTVPPTASAISASSDWRGTLPGSSSGNCLTLSWSAFCFTPKARNAVRYLKEINIFTFQQGKHSEGLTTCPLQKRSYGVIVSLNKKHSSWFFLGKKLVPPLPSNRSPYRGKQHVIDNVWVERFNSWDALAQLKPKANGQAETLRGAAWPRWYLGLGLKSLMLSR